MTKVVKLELISQLVDKNSVTVPYADVCKVLFALQRQTREIKNKTVQYCWEWMNFSSDYVKANGMYPKEKDVLGYTMSGFVYDRFKTGNDLYTSNLSTSTREVCAKFKKQQANYLRGDVAILNYKQNQPIDVHNKAITLCYEDKTFFVNLNLINNKAAKSGTVGGTDVVIAYKNTAFPFKILVSDKSTQTILERCYDGVYKVSASKLQYNRKKKQWLLYLSYTFDNVSKPELDENKILGVDLGVVKPIVASVFGSKKRFMIDNDEITAFRKKVAVRKVALQKQGKWCGDGRKGHGYKTRNKPVLNISDKIARFRDTTNHKYSKALVDYAVKQGCGTIQMENLEGVAKDDLFLKDWTYYDLQQKIEYKAKEKGITVVYVKPKYTSQRCSKCGYIDKENRETQATFVCKSCGFTENADYNASQNIALQNIDKIIEEQTSI